MKLAYIFSWGSIFSEKRKKKKEKRKKKKRKKEKKKKEKRKDARKISTNTETKHQKMDIFIVNISIVCVLVFILAAYFPCIRSVFQEGLDSTSGIPIPKTGIPNGYYKISATTMANVPYGYMAKTDKSGIVPLTRASMYAAQAQATAPSAIIDPTQTTDFSNTKYQNDISKIMNIEYHESEDQLRKREKDPIGSTWIYDMCGNKVLYPSTKVQGSMTYYTPGSYPFGTSNYVPNYEDSVFLSKITGLSTTMNIKPTAEMLGGFCSFYKNQPDKMEEACKNTGLNQCASNSCCVLLGGSNCVSGNESGPYKKTNYGDIFIRNKDFYYYQGKCYGNCN